MDPSVKAAWISSSVALAVAVIGVIATGVAQVRGSKAAHANALALFERQDEEQAEIRSKETMERRRTAFLADRRAVYAKFLSAKRRLKDETTRIEALKKRYAILTAEPTGDTGRNAELTRAPKIIDSAYDIRTEVYNEVVLALEEMFMLAPLEVVDTAADWHNAAGENEAQLHAHFLNAARLDVGAEPLGRLPVR